MGERGSFNLSVCFSKAAPQRPVHGTDGGHGGRAFKKCTEAAAAAAKTHVKLLILRQGQHGADAVLELSRAVWSWTHRHLVRAAVERHAHVRCDLRVHSTAGHSGAVRLGDDLTCPIQGTSTTGVR